MTAVRVEKRFIVCEVLLMNLAVGVTTAKRGNAVIFYNNFPIAFCDVEAAECFEILLAGDEGSRAILSNRTRKAVAGDQVSTLTHSRHYIHGQNNRSLRLGLVGNGEIRGRSLPGGERLITDVLIVWIGVCRAVW